MGRQQGYDSDLRTGIYAYAGGDRLCGGDRNPGCNCQCSEGRTFNGSAYFVLTAGHISGEVRKPWRL